MNAFERLLHDGHSIVLIEHNMEVIKCADWIIDMGPEGGDAGGRIVAMGTPRQIAQTKNSFTGQYLNFYL
jgi:excinuclease ABC subunit A